MNTIVRETVRPSTAIESRSGPGLKLVTSIVRPEKLSDVMAALSGLNLSGGITVSEVQGGGDSLMPTRFFRGTPYVVQWVSERKIEVIVPEERVNEIVESIQKNAPTGAAGDGKIWVTDVGMAIPIRAGDRGLAAL